MRQLAPSEMLSIRELLQMESNALTKARATRAIVQDRDLQKQVDAAILAAEGRVKGIQQFITENNVVDVTGVH
ncbi:MAG: hypothetical protein K0R93_2704 [Anaerosolibacter sp.]|uniref:hypothetical protein n=1 Tax=Anaerosolibacter sp. TaxID=1872527 RepID=UPI0026288D28|nr:hypothetical protein [Anaerosolibacter sp.]MDF2547806.1 hypothetical protein [Anaerosolibacter sp.]